jgi:hypothetical protein
MKKKGIENDPHHNPLLKETRTSYRTIIVLRKAENERAQFIPGENDRSLSENARGKESCRGFI